MTAPAARRAPYLRMVRAARAAPTVAYVPAVGDLVRAARGRALVHVVASIEAELLTFACGRQLPQRDAKAVSTAASPLLPCPGCHPGEP